MVRQISPNQIYHIYNRAVLKMPLFRDTRDYLRFISRLSELKKQNPSKLIAYCLMPNHFHLLMREPAKSPNSNMPYISIFLQRLQNSYAKYFAIKYKHSGRVFQGTFKNKLIETDEQLQVIVDYIHNNPVRAKIVKNPNKWPYSSASNPNI